MNKFKKIDKFFKDNAIESLSIIEGKECEFSRCGCDICDDGLGNNVFECEGYSPKYDDILSDFDVCHECICLIYNGE